MSETKPLPAADAYVLLDMTIDHGQIGPVSEVCRFASLDVARTFLAENQKEGRYRSDEGFALYRTQYEIVGKIGDKYYFLDGTVLPVLRDVLVAS